MIEPVTELTLESPAGLIRVRAECSGGKVRKVTFRNVPSFAVHLDKKIEVPHLGPVIVDVAYGGMFYVISEAAPHGLSLSPDEGRDIVRIGEMIKAAAQEQLPVAHPTEPAFAGITIAILTAPPAQAGSHARNAVIVSTGKLDWQRPATAPGPVPSISLAPCGSRHQCPDGRGSRTKGKLLLNEDFHHEGILGTVFTGRLVEETQVGPYRAVVPTISGRAWITGFCNYVLEEDDPFPEGFRVGDIW